MKRAKHNLSHYRLMTCNMGQVVPIACVPVLPGDTMQQRTSALVRLSPLNTPVMHPTTVRVHHFFVPNRIIMPEWEDFITGGPDGISAPTIPTVFLSNTKGNLHDHLYGAISASSGDVPVSALPLRAFNKIYNEYYRDQDIVPERLEDDDSIPLCAWEKDYFGIARPWTQKGPDVTFPVGDRAEVYTEIPTDIAPLSIRSDVTSPGIRPLESDAALLTLSTLSGSEDNQLWADLAGASGPSVNDFRAAFSLQRYQEARARYGSRFTEYLRYLGIRPSDARLQRPEYLGGGRQSINFSEVLQTAPNDASGGPEPSLGIGDMFGHGISGIRSNRYRKFFEEHGFIISCISVRPKAMYLNGVPREYLKTTKEDYFQKELANLGQQEVHTNELFADGTNNDETFGFSDRYQEYRHHPSQVAGDFRDTLNAWHMGRDLDASVTLNESFVACKPTDRIFQVGEDNANTLWVMVNNKIAARRIVPKRANPRIL